MPDAAVHPPSTGRIEAFSDGVVAIIITIMILELKLPLGAFEHGQLAPVLSALGPPLLSYMLSFVMVAIMLLNHHSLMRIAPHATTGLYWWNANLLFWMSLIPLATAAMGDHYREPLAVAFYGAVLCANAVAFTLLHSYCDRLGAGRTPAHMTPFVRRDMIATSLWLVGAGLAFVSVYLSFALYVSLAAIYVLPRYGDNASTSKG
jgi:uncharacterized membrane protein